MMLSKRRAQLRRWADVVLVAPCSANTLAKIAGGLCDNLLVRVAALRLCRL
jgi:phosphopantothenoylcysteine synthetase/decarboxylase